MLVWSSCSVWVHERCPYNASPQTSRPFCVIPPFHIHRDAPMSISAYISRLPPPPKEQQIQVRARAVQQCSIHLGSLLPA